MLPPEPARPDEPVQRDAKLGTKSRVWTNLVKGQIGAEKEDEETAKKKKKKSFALPVHHANWDVPQQSREKKDKRTPVLALLGTIPIARAKHLT